MTASRTSALGCWNKNISYTNSKYLILQYTNRSVYLPALSNLELEICFVLGTLSVPDREMSNRGTKIPITAREAVMFLTVHLMLQQRRRLSFFPSMQRLFNIDPIP